MALAIDITNGRDLSNEALCELLLKKEQGNAVLAFTYLTRWSISVLSQCDMWVSKLIKDWPIVLRHVRCIVKCKTSEKYNNQ